MKYKTFDKPNMIWVPYHKVWILKFFLNTLYAIFYCTILTYLYNTILSSTTQYYAIQLNMIRHNTLPYNTIQYNTIQLNTMKYNAIQYNTIQYNTIQ